MASEVFQLLFDNYHELAKDDPNIGSELFNIRYQWSDCPGYNVVLELLHQLKHAETAHVLEQNMLKFTFNDRPIAVQFVMHVANDFDNSLTELLNGEKIETINEWW